MRSGAGSERPVLTCAEVREVERLAIEELGIPAALLMENAGRAVAEHVIRLLGGPSFASVRPSVLVACGPGNNGGDGWVAARHLHAAGLAVQVAATGPPKSGGDAARMRRIAELIGLPVLDVATPAGLAVARAEVAAGPIDAVVDALLGTGSRGGVRAEMAGVIAWIADLRSAGAKVVAVDLPSGLDGDTGAASGAIVRADATVTFLAAKRRLLEPRASVWAGRIEVEAIGTPPEIVERVARSPRPGRDT